MVFKLFNCITKGVSTQKWGLDIISLRTRFYLLSSNCNYCVYFHLNFHVESGNFPVNMQTSLLNSGLMSDCLLGVSQGLFAQSEFSSSASKALQNVFIKLKRKKVKSSDEWNHEVFHLFVLSLRKNMKVIDPQH